jgi:hypothetical protein
MEVSCKLKSQISVIVAEDYEPFRRFLCSMLAKDSVLQVIAEVQDGLVSRPGDFVSTNAFPGIGIGPAKRFR